MQQNEKLFIRLFEEPERQFLQHLSIENNERIIFSGKFGHGKTTFLSEFFKKENQKNNFKGQKYNVISLFPVNYSIASNEDIFKYIKYDIILEMLANGYKVEEILIDEINTLPKYLWKQKFKILALIIGMVPKVGKDLQEALEKIEKFSELVKEFKENHQNQEAKANETNVLIEFIEELEEKEGSVFEDNVVSKLIEKLLNEVKGENEFCENVLIIDDLDRIDPEHIFRILNIFAAHFDRKHKSTNKFGFDKIIIVCDIENIRNIFKSKYGINTDFNGYIDKFYSYDIFFFNIRKEIADFAWSAIKEASLRYSNGPKISGPAEGWIRGKLFNDRMFFIDVLSILFDTRQIDLRNIVKWREMPIFYDDYVLFTNTSILTERILVCFFIQLLCKIKGSPTSLKNTLEFGYGKSIPEDRILSHIQDLIFLNTVLDHKGKPDSSRKWRYVIIDCPVYLTIMDNGDLSIAETTGKPLYFDNSHLFWLISKSVDFLHSQDVI